MKKWDGITKLTTKRGRYGASKFKAFSVLAELPPKHYLSVRKLCLMSGIGYYSLARALPRWTRWEYVARYPTTVIGQGDYMYRLLAKGKSWLDLAIVQLPNANLFKQELKEWQNHIVPRWNEYMVLPFEDFVMQLHDEIVKLGFTKIR